MNPSLPFARARAVGLAGAFALIAAIGGLWWIDQRTGTLRAGSVDWSVTLILVAVCGWLAAAWASERRVWSMATIWTVAVVMRVILLLTEPTLSDDVFRYLWDGHIIGEGINPYDYAINDPALDEYSIPARGMANNPGFASPYLPFAHATFGLLDVVFGPSVKAMQVLMTFAELAAAAIIAQLLRLASLPAHRLILWLWNPLVAIEVAHGAHLDGLLVLLALLSVACTWWAYETQGRIQRTVMVMAPLALAASALTRPLALLWFPVLGVRWTRWQIAGFLAAVGLPILFMGATSERGFALGSDVPTGVFGSSGVYTRTFRFNAGISSVIENNVGADAFLPLIVVVAGVACVGAGVMAWRTAHVRGSLRLLVIPAAAYALLTPVFHPWYLLIVLAVAPLLAPGADEIVTASRRWATTIPWLLLGALAPLSYLTYRDPSQFGELRWVRQVIWWPTVIAVVVAVAASLSLQTRGGQRTI